MDKLAQTTIKLGPSSGSGFQGFGKLGLENANASQSGYIFAEIISSTIGIITIVAIIWFTIQLLIGAVSIISSGGDKSKNEAARAKITSALTGLIVVIAGVFITNLVGTLLGFPNILDIGQLIGGLKL